MTGCNFIERNKKMTKLEICTLQIKSKYFSLIKAELERNLAPYEEPFIERVCNIEQLFLQCETEVQNARKKLRNRI